MILGIVPVVLYPRSIYYLFFFLLPFSVEVYLTDVMGTDLPAEPFMLFFTCIGAIWLAQRYGRVKLSFLLHPITLLLLGHMFWILITVISSQDYFVSIKYFLAKIWYIVPFFFLPFIFLNTRKEYIKWIAFLLTGLVIACIYVLFNHAGMGMTFSTVNSAVSPIFRNHVNYACLLVISLPLYYLLVKWTSKSTLVKILLFLVGLILLIALYFSYTRVAYISLIIAIVTYFLLKWRLLKISIFIGLIAVVLVTGFFLHRNQYLHYSPEYERTVAHYKFDRLIDATAKMEDISIMERVYRWVAGYQMIRERPLLGFGPGTFFFFYKSYTVSSFQTYVSDNPDKSGIHNYYLMTAVEQGIPGLLLFLGLILFSLMRGIDRFHSLEEGYNKDLVLAAILILVIICSIISINDMIEAAKVGPFFFLALAIIMKNDSN